MRICHNSQKLEYRRPFGAVGIGTKVQLLLSVSEADPNCRAFIRFWTEQDGEAYYPMKLRNTTDRGFDFSYDFCAPNAPQLVWYSFEVWEKGQRYRYGNNAQNLGGEGQIYNEIPPSFQITVFRPHEIPLWYREAIVYQIFPDRYYRGKDWRRRMEDSFRNTDWDGPRHIIRQDWNDMPCYLKDKQGNVTHWDFFGGTLEGIQEKLDHLESLGIGVIYLNPIFEASSNHRYDAADYLKIDSRLGDDKSFSSLCREAKKREIFIILDGVFNHSGCDSIYFDRYGNYGGQGAWGRKDSRYASWYKFSNTEHTEYDCWWGAKDLPAFDKGNPNYRDFIYQAESAVVRHWMKMGARGWRLDVADELPDDFIQGIKTAVTETDPEGLLIGEVWEDASHKISYGKMRSYLLGDELDGVMNYPFRDIFLEFLNGKYSAGDVLQKTMSLYENYPLPNYHANLNLIGSHDRIRILTLLGLNQDEKSIRVDQQPIAPLTPEQSALAIQKLCLLVNLQMTFPGVPCIYYGDELGMEGGADPYNRAPYPWGKENDQVLKSYRTAIALRKEWNVFVDGNFKPFSFGDHVFGFTRKNAEDEVSVFCNRSPNTEATVVFHSGYDALDLFSATTVKSIHGQISLELPALGTAALLLRKNATNVTYLPRGAGVLCHITSLPSEWGNGQLGKDARRFLAQLSNAGQSYWQVLPLNPVDQWNSPYATSSAFAGNEMLIDPDDLVGLGLLSTQVITSAKKELRVNLGSLRFSDGLKMKMRLLREAYSRFAPAEDYLNFCGKNSFWLKDYCRYRAIQDHFPNIPWQEWPKPYRDRDVRTLQDPSLEKEASFYSFCQYLFARQWKALREFANAHHIKIIGDLPFYVGENSVDVWSFRNLFCLDSEGYSTDTAGVPPDYFSREGQSWSNPVYHWDRMKKDGYHWWVQRFQQATQRYDIIRLDHFRGFEQFWNIPKGEKASTGCWKFGPGRDLFEAVKRQIGTLPILAEDLGEITAPVRDLILAYGLSGMDVLQFSAKTRLHEGAYQAKENAILYSGTHDNQTLKGWCLKQYPDRDSSELSSLVIRRLYESAAPVVMLPMQDILGLGDDARMNTPGTILNNWQWQFSSDAFSEELRTYFKALSSETTRIAENDLL